MLFERIGWIALVIAVGVIVHGRKPRPAEAPSAPAAIGLSDEVRAYVDQKIAGRATAGRDPGAIGALVRELEAKVASLEQTSQLRVAVQAKCADVTREFRKLFDEQTTIGEIQRDQEIGRLRNRTATNCADVPVATPVAKKGLISK